MHGPVIFLLTRRPKYKLLDFISNPDDGFDDDPDNPDHTRPLTKVEAALVAVHAEENSNTCSDHKSQKLVRLPPLV